MDGIGNYLLRLQEMKLGNPIVTGFNIHDNETFNRASKYTRGAIIGSAFIREISGSDNIEETTRSFIEKIKS
jgi:tryptophan synthase alpha chain